MFSKPALYLFSSVLLLSFTKVLVKYLHRIPSFELLFFRSLFILICTYPILWRRKISLSSPHWKTLLLRGFSGTSGMLLLFYVVQKTALASSVSLFYTTPIFTVILAHFLLKEKMPKEKWFWFFLCFIGVFFIKSYSFDLPLKEFSLALLAALCASLAYNSIRMLKNKVPTLLIVFYLPLIGLPIFGALTWFHWVPPNFEESLLIFTICLTTLFTQILLTLAYQNAQAYKISHINYLGLPLGVLWGLFFFDEVPNIFTLIGVAFIFTGLVMSQAQKKIK